MRVMEVSITWIRERTPRRAAGQGYYQEFRCSNYDLITAKYIPQNKSQAVTNSGIREADQFIAGLRDS
ncbi:hypothetical protein [Desulfobulbus alkaliphilus]|uniref:hypothetical protein n=1 Tax=Desulfobulbus alkaliphilus TaxID=869814 RepID=UPI0019641021|nr:hypothetical protein [Desulfobulbus alkaliphilus]